jgi:hypothetical protein
MPARALQLLAGCTGSASSYGRHRTRSALGILQGARYGLILFLRWCTPATACWLLAQLDVSTPAHVITMFTCATRAVEDATDKMQVPHTQLARGKSVSVLSPSPKLLKRSMWRARRALVQHRARLLVGLHRAREPRSPTLGTQPPSAASNVSTAFATSIWCLTPPTRAWLRAPRRKPVGCHLLVTWHLNEWRRVTAHLRARSASVSGGPRGFFKVRRASVCACIAARLFWGRRGVRRRGGGAGQAHSRRAFWRACAVAPAARALLRCLSRRLRLAGRGSWRPAKPLLVSELPSILAGALRVGFRRPARLVKVRRASGRARGAARLFWGRRGVARRGAEGCKPPASGLACAHRLPRLVRCCA